MAIGDVHNILMIGPTVSDKNVDLSTATYDTVEILHQLGYKIAIIVEDPSSLLSSGEFVDRIIVDRVTGENVLNYINLHHPDAILPTIGDRNALGIIASLNGKIGNVKVLGTNYLASLATFKRELFIKKLIQNELPVINFISSDDETEIYSFIRSIGFPIIARRKYSNRHFSGWTNINNIFELDNFMALEDLKDTKIEIERSIRGFSEYSFTVLRDSYENASLVGTIEDIEPIGIHHLDSNLLSPAVSLNDSKLQKLRNYSIKLAQAFNIVGACTVHFAYNHKTNECYITEFIPRLSEETKFLEYATSYPIATVVVELCLGYHLDKLQLDSGSNFNGAIEPFVDHITSRFPQWTNPTQRYLGPSKTSNSSIVVNGFSIEEVLNRGALNNKLNNNINRHNQLKELDDDELFEKIIHPTNWMLDVLLEALRRKFEIPVLSEITGIRTPYLVALNNILKNSALLGDDVSDSNSLERLVEYGIKGVGYSKILLDSDDIVTKTVVKSKRAIDASGNSNINHNYFITSGITNDIQFTEHNKIIVRSPIITSKTDIMVRQFVLLQLVKSITQNGLEAIVIGREPWTSPLAYRNRVIEIDDPHREMTHLNLISNEHIFKIIDFSKSWNVDTEDENKEDVFPINYKKIKQINIPADTLFKVMVVTDGKNYLAPSIIYQTKSGNHVYELSAYNNFMTTEEKNEIMQLIKQELDDNEHVNIFNIEIAKSNNDHFIVTKVYQGMTEDIIRHELASSVHVIDTLVKLILGNKIDEGLSLNEIFQNHDDHYLVKIDNKHFRYLDLEGTQKVLNKIEKKEGQ